MNADLRNAAWHGAFDVSSHSIDVIDSLAKEAIEQDEDAANDASPAMTAVRGYFAKRGWIEFDDLESVYRDRNPSGDALRVLIIRASLEEKYCKISISAISQQPISLETFRISSGSDSRLRSRLKHELKNTRTRYSGLLAAIGSASQCIHKIPIFVSVFALFLSIGLIAYALYAAHQHDENFAQWEQESIDIIAKVNEARGGLSPDEKTHEMADQLQSIVDNVEAPGSLRDGVAWIILSFITAYLVVSIWRYIFPRVSFLIGEGVERHAHARYYRRLVVWGIVVSGVVVPLIFFYFTT